MLLGAFRGGNPLERIVGIPNKWESRRAEASSLKSASRQEIKTLTRCAFVSTNAEVFEVPLSIYLT